MSPWSGEGLKARVLRGSALTVISFGGANALRLAGNLVLTRVLFPEAFGLMALVQVFISGLQMFSDLGIRVSIIQNKRGDDPAFLNTAWSVQIIRGVILWLAGCALALPAARLYNEPMLAQLLPVASLNALILGFVTTKMATANRHLMLGRLTAVELGTQAAGIVIMVILAIWWQSVWALVIGGILSTLLKVILLDKVLPGHRNRLQWERAALHDLFGFGKYIFLSTIAGFLIRQSDRAVLGAYISLAALGVYNVGYFLGTVPILLSRAAVNRIILPVYRMRPTTENVQNRAQVFQTRRFLIAGTMMLGVILAYSGVPLVEFLYDDRYHLAGPVVVLFSLTMVPQLVLDGYSSILLAAGDSRRFLILVASTAIIQLVYLFVGISWLGIFGAIFAPGLAILTTYPLRIAYARRYNAWDPKADIGFLALGAAVNGYACWLYWDEIVKLIG